MTCHELTHGASGPFPFTWLLPLWFAVDVLLAALLGQAVSRQDVRPTTTRNAAIVQENEWCQVSYVGLSAAEEQADWQTLI